MSQEIPKPRCVYYDGKGGVVMINEAKELPDMATDRGLVMFAEACLSKILFTDAPIRLPSMGLDAFLAAYTHAPEYHCHKETEG